MNYAGIVAIVLGVIILCVIFAALIKNLKWGSRNYGGELVINDSNPDEPPYKLLIDKDLDMNSVEEIRIKVTHI